MHKKINTYYLSHLSELPFEKQFHYASRLWLWTGEPTYGELLKQLRSGYANDLSLDGIDGLLGELLASQTPEFGSKNAATERAPYFARYPLLRQVLPLLFRLLFIENIYGVDARKVLGNHVNLQQVEELAEALADDPEAIAILSTHASNFFYLWHRFYKRDEASVPIEQLYRIGKTGYDLSNRTHMQLLIYLYTHCIIGESLFYKRGLPATHTAIYLQMCEDLERLIEENFHDINLDNKCEFLVVCKIAGFSSSLQQRIYNEAEKSLSSDGDFIIDRHNLNPQTDNVSIDKSEHRNVLFVMSGSPYRVQTSIIS